MRVEGTGCAICGSTWGDYWEEVDGQSLFFCCSLCATQFKNMVQEVKRRTGWKAVAEVRMAGDYRGRECTAFSPDGKEYSFAIWFDSQGGIQGFKPI